MPNTIEYIGDYAFFGDSNLTSRMIFDNSKGAGPLTIGVSAFQFTDLSYFEFIGGDITVCDYAFANLKRLVCRGRSGKVTLSPLSGYNL